MIYTPKSLTIHEHVDFVQSVRDFRLKNSENYLFCDVETTGLKPLKHEVISIGWILTDKRLNVIDRESKIIRPISKQWDDSSEKVHGISKVKASAGVDKFEYLSSFLDLIPPYCTFVSHTNKSIDGYFDFNMLMFDCMKLNLDRKFSQKLDQLNQISTVDYAKQANLPVENYKLNTLCEYFGIELDHHNAESDTNACYEVFKKLSEV